MASFPCPREQVAASALLLLSTTTPRSVFDSMSITSRIRCHFDVNQENSIEETSKIRSCRWSSELSDSVSVASLEGSDLSVDETSPRRTRIIEFAPCRSEMKLKVVRKARSKIRTSSGGWKLSSGENTVTSSGSVSTESSCLTTGCSADSSARNSGYVTRVEEAREEQRRKLIGSNHIRRRAQGILNLLSGRCFSEVTIRQLLGDSPDTSKALRILLKLEQVKRSGIGGRQDPYIYTRA